MSNLLDQIEERERILQQKKAQSSKEKEVIIGQYREKAYQEIAQLKAVSDEKKKQMLAEMNAVVESIKHDIDHETEDKKMFVDAQYQQNKAKAKALLIEEVLFDGNR